MAASTSSIQSRSYPNPFIATSTIEYNLAQPSEVSLQVYDRQGRLIAQLLQGQEQEKGPQQAEWQPSAKIPTGLYIYAIFVDGQLAGQGKVQYQKNK